MSQRATRASRILVLAVVVGLAFPIAPKLTQAGTVLAAAHNRTMSGASTVRRLVASPGTQSINWSGYAITGGTYRSVTGQWTVPRVTATAGLSASAIWIGIDGVLEDI